MTMYAQQGMNVRGYFELRSGQCPVCGTEFDNDLKPPRGDARYCPKCDKYEIGVLKVEGVLVPK